MIYVFSYQEISMDYDQRIDALVNLQLSLVKDDEDLAVLMRSGNAESVEFLQHVIDTQNRIIHKHQKLTQGMSTIIQDLMEVCRIMLDKIEPDVKIKTDTIKTPVPPSLLHTDFTVIPINLGPSKN